MTHDYRTFHLQKFARGKATTGESGISNSEYSNGRRTSYRLSEYFEFYLRAKAETEERNQEPEALESSEPQVLWRAWRIGVILSRSLGEQADGRSKRPNGYHQWLKRQKHRLERHRAKQNPECNPGYGRYRGYET